LAVVEESEIPGREVRNRVPSRVRYNQVDAEEAFPHDRIGRAQGRQWLLRNGLISQRRSLPACPASRENDHAGDKSCALRVEFRLRLTKTILQKGFITRNLQHGAA
jgi:hypothetical protein